MVFDWLCCSFAVVDFESGEAMNGPARVIRFSFEARDSDCSARLRLVVVVRVSRPLDPCCLFTAERHPLAFLISFRVLGFSYAPSAVVGIADFPC